MGLFADDPRVAVITSEEWLLRGTGEVRTFLERYVSGPTTYSWQWQRHDVAVVGSVAWLLAEGVEIATTPSGAQQHQYRMTMLLTRHSERWLLMQVHGSSPQ